MSIQKHFTGRIFLTNQPIFTSSLTACKLHLTHSENPNKFHATVPNSTDFPTA